MITKDTDLGFASAILNYCSNFWDGTVKSKINCGSGFVNIVKYELKIECIRDIYVLTFQ